MSSEVFEYLLNEMGSKMLKQVTVFMKAIPGKERLVITIRF